MYGSGTGYGAGGMQRDRITQALMDIQNPPPASDIPFAPPAPSAAQPGAVPPTATGVPGVSPMAGAPGTMPGMPQQPGGMPGAAAPQMPRY